MKKSLIALAVLAASGTAFAQSTVTLSGIIKGGVAQTKYSGSATPASNGSATGLQDGSSRFILSGTEDLGGGLKANFQLDTRLRLDDNGGTPNAAATPTTVLNGSQLAGGNSFLGLSGGFGNIQLGKLDTHYCMGSDSHGVRATALTASSCALLGFVNGSSGAAAVATGSRSTNSVRYTAPAMGGLTLQGTYSFAPGGSEGAVGPTSGGNSSHIQGVYVAGPLTVGASMYQSKGEDQTATVARTGQKASTFMANYNLGVATIGLTYDTSARRDAAASAGFIDTERTTTSIPVTVPMGAGTALFTYSKAGNTKTAGVTNANTGATLLAVGYDHALSKRTTLGISYAKLDNKSAASYALYTQSALGGTPGNGVGTDAAQFYLGLRHTF
jgi:predicted porin